MKAVALVTSSVLAMAVLPVVSVMTNLLESIISPPFRAVAPATVAVLDRAGRAGNTERPGSLGVRTNNNNKAAGVPGLAGPRRVKWTDRCQAERGRCNLRFLLRDSFRPVPGLDER